MMDDVDRICRLHNLNYSLAYGTLIGAIRHNGIIPWDDDIDVQMPREDYEKFIEIYKKEGKYLVTSPKSKDPLYSYAKVYNGATTKLESGISYRKRSPLGIDIDIFPLDNYNVKKISSNNIPNKRIFQILYFLRWYAIGEITTKKSRKYPFLSYCLGVFTHLIGNRFLMRLFEIIASSYNKYASDYYTIYNDMETISIFEKKDFSSFLRHPFENRFYNIPVGYDNILRVCYGDYMKLPPEEERVTHHMNSIYWNK